MSKHPWTTLMMAVVAILVGCATPPHPAEVDRPELLPNHSFQRAWATDVPGAGSVGVTNVYISEAFVFAYQQDGSASVMDRGAGTLLHVDHPREGDQRMHPPVVLKDRIVYPTTSFLEVFDFGGRYIPHATRPTDELDKPFSQALPYPIRSDVVGTGKMVFFGGDFPNSGRAVALDLTHPYVPEFWTLMAAGSSVAAAPALVKDVVYVASADGRVASVSIETREPLWPSSNGYFLTYGGVMGNLAADETGVYVASTDTKLYCLQRGSGRVKWQYFAGTDLRDGPSLTKDMVYQFVPNTGIVAIEKGGSSSTRGARWAANDAIQFLAEDKTYAYLRTGDNRIVAVNLKTGQQEFSSSRRDLVAFATNTKDDTIYVATSGGRVIAARPVLEPGRMGEIVLAPSTPTGPLAAATH